MRRHIVTITLLALGASASAEPRFYAGASLGASRFDDTASTGAHFPDFGPGVPIDFQTFHSSETAWGASFGWQAKRWLAVELGYSDLGNSGTDLSVLQAFPSLPSPGVSYGPPLPPGSYGVAVQFRNSVALGIADWHVGTRFSVPLSPRFQANWLAAVSRARFDVQGVVSVLPVFGGEPPTYVPFVSPGDETGLVWGFGFGWRVNSWLSLDLAFRRHDTRVLDVDTASLGVLFSF
jgi:OmpA-like transmembrane domain